MEVRPMGWNRLALSLPFLGLGTVFPQTSESNPLVLDADSYVVDRNGAPVAAPVRRVRVWIKRCDGCADEVMYKQALADTGINHVFDVTRGKVQRWDVTESGVCSRVRNEADGPDDDRSLPDGTGERGDTACAALRTGYRRKIDPSIMAIFHALRSAYELAPEMYQSGLWKLPIPTDVLTGQPFDLRAIAWEYPQASYRRFADWITATINDDDRARSLSPAWGITCWHGDGLLHLSRSAPMTASYGPTWYGMRREPRH